VILVSDCSRPPSPQWDPHPARAGQATAALRLPAHRARTEPRGRRAESRQCAWWRHDHQRPRRRRSAPLRGGSASAERR